jgi:hypothetical protein
VVSVPKRCTVLGGRVQEVAQVFGLTLGKEGIEEDKDKESRQVTRSIESQTFFLNRLQAICEGDRRRFVLIGV